MPRRSQHWSGLGWPILETELSLHADAVLIRAAAYPGHIDLPAWPDMTGTTDEHAGQRRGWLAQAWSREWLADAIGVASPVLARQVARVIAGSACDPRRLRLLMLAVARYALRMSGRATPFGLFAGVAPASVGPDLRVRWGEDHRPVLRAGASWLADAVTRLEAYPELLARLPVVANNLAFTRDGRLVAPDQQHVGGWGEGRGLAVPVELSVRLTGPVGHLKAPKANATSWRRTARSVRVRRQGLEPRTRGLRVRCSAN